MTEALFEAEVEAITPVGPLERDDFIFESSSPSNLFVEQDLFRKPVSTFRDHALAFERTGHRVRVRCDDGEQHLRGFVRAVRALLPISHSPKRKVEPRRELFLRQIQLLTPRAHTRNTSSTRKLRLGRGRSVRVRSSGSMALVFHHGVEGAPIAFWRLLRIEPKSRDTFFFHAAPLSCGDDARDVTS